MALRSLSRTVQSSLAGRILAASAPSSAVFSRGLGFPASSQREFSTKDKGGKNTNTPPGKAAPLAAKPQPKEIEDEDDFDEGEEGEIMDLAEALASEIAVEAAEDTVDPELLDIKKQIQQNFSISDVTGRGVVTLKSIAGKNPVLNGDSIEITFDCQDEAEADPSMDDLEAMQAGAAEAAERGEEGEEPMINFGINFTATITKKNGDRLLVDCVASEQLQVDNVQFIPASASGTKPASASEVDGTLYGGPVFEHLDQSLQDAFYDYLEDRFIDQDLCFFVLSYARHKEQKEYVNWLNKVLDFVEPK